MLGELRSLTEEYYRCSYCGERVVKVRSDATNSGIPHYCRRNYFITRTTSSFNYVVLEESKVKNHRYKLPDKFIWRERNKSIKGSE